MRRSGRFIALLALLCLLAVFGCDRLPATTPSVAAIGQQIGILDAPTLPPAVFSTMCDPSDGSPCNATSFRATMRTVLAAAADRPGSIVRCWVLGDDLPSTRLVAEQTVPVRVSGQSDRALAASRERFITSAETFFEKAFEPIFAAAPIRRSIIAEGFTRIALTGVPSGFDHIVVAITDGLQCCATTIADLECGPVPSGDAFGRALHDDRLLAPESFADVAVAFVFMDLGEIRRKGCPVTIARALAVRELWSGALQVAGARAVTFSTGGPDPAVFQRAEVIR